MWEPVGPLPASIYWRRRCLVGAGLLAALVLVGSVVGGSGDAPAPVGDAVAAPERPAELVSAPLPGGVPACTDAMLAVVAEIDRAEHRVGQQPVMRLVVTNVGAQPCVRDLDPARQEVVVWSEDLKTRLWSSNDCGNEAKPDPRTLLPNQPLGFRVTWGGRTSTPGCTERRAVVPAGSYNVTTRVDDVISPPTPFSRSS